MFCLPALARQSSADPGDLQKNKKVVERYFFEIIDRMGVGDTAPDQWKVQAGEVEKVFDQIFTQNAIQRFPGLPPSAPKGFLNVIRLGLNKSMKTTVHHMVAEGDLVVAHVSHDLTPRAGTMIPSPRIGCMVQASGGTIHWEAMALFKVENGKIVEEWISRDDLGQLLQQGKITFEPCAPMPKK
jgi:predicted SnoaL-like aldol condensation-catalyzing enzyme